jgi:hypothetical protein
MICSKGGTSWMGKMTAAARRRLAGVVRRFDGSEMIVDG